jgi:hypothetical protein
MKQSKTYYEVRLMPIIGYCDVYDFDNTNLVCGTTSKLWAFIRQTIACWKMPPDHTCILIVCRPSREVDK